MWRQLVFATMIGWSSVAAADHEVYCLDNGLQIVLEPREGRPIVGLSMIIDGGSGAETEGAEGTAHVLEHLWFRSKPRGVEVTDTLFQLGAWYNAATETNVTTYTTIVPRRSIRTALALEAARLTDPIQKIHIDTFRAERLIVQQEAQERRGSATNWTSALSAQVLSPTHPYARMDDRPEDLTSKDMFLYARKWYRPENATLVMAGQLSKEVMLREVKAAFGSESAVPGACDRTLPDPGSVPAPPPRPDKVPRTETNVSTPTLAMGWSMPNVEDPTFYERVSTLLDFRERRTYCNVIRHTQMSIMFCLRPLKPKEDPDAVASRMQRKVKGVWVDAKNWTRLGHDDVHWAWGKLGQLYQPVERPRSKELRRVLSPYADGYLPTLGKQYQLGRPAVWNAEEGGYTETDLNEAGTNLSKLTPMLEQLLSPERARFIALYPEEKEGPSNAIALNHARERLPEDLGVADLETLQALVVPPSPREIDVFRLPTGLQVWAVFTPQVGQDGYAHAVFPMDPAWRSNPSLFSLDNNILQIPNFKNNRVKRNLWVGWYSDASGWSLIANGGRPAEGLAEISRQINFQPRARSLEEVEKMFKVSTDRHTAWIKKPSGQAYQARWDHLSGGTPHPFSPEGRKRIRDLDQLDLERFTASVLQPRHATLLLLSESDPKTARPAVEAGPLATWKPRPPPATPEPWPWPDARDREVVVVPKSDATAQASLTLECRVERSTLALTLVKDLIGQRLEWQLRKTMGATYGVGAQVTDEPWGKKLSIASDIDLRATGSSVQRIFGVLDELANGEFTQAELDRLKLAFARKSAFQWQTTTQLASWYEDLAAAGLPPTTAYNLADALHAVTVQDLQDALSGCVGKEIITVLGEGELVTEALDAAGVSYRVLEQADE